MYRLNISYKQVYITINEIWLYESDPNAPPVLAANLVANMQIIAYGVDVINLYTYFEVLDKLIVCIINFEPFFHIVWILLVEMIQFEFETVHHI